AFQDHPHPLNFNLGKISGGNWPSSVPGECEFTMRISFYPGVDPQEAKSRLLAELRPFLQQDPWFRQCPPVFTWYGHHDWGVYEPAPEQNPFLQTVARAHAAVTERPVEYLASTACTDVRFWTEHWGRPATCYGPR